MTFLAIIGAAAIALTVVVVLLWTFGFIELVEENDHDHQA